ncbi:hypothetical protein QYE76_048210 [Lolium multiflorum]|uniref:CCHC-type domain-containing protein n=1 Tax=Lolium multiflorum TaxID=4521 RepID=A0AAD8QKY1_LOLMU|nr:hypothetical protein QYE76_048210 [Lolium multiflorum]
MCLKARVCSGDSEGDWDVALPPRRRRRRSAAHGGRRNVAVCVPPEGSRFALLAEADAPLCSAGDGDAAVSDLELEELTVGETRDSPAVRCLGSFLEPPWTGPVMFEAPSSPVGLSVDPRPPPELSVAEFPPLSSGGMPRAGTLSAPCSSGGSLCSQSFRVGEVAIPLPALASSPRAAALRRPVRGDDAEAVGETLAGLPGPQGRPGPGGLSTVGGPVQVGPGGILAPSVESTDGLHVVVSSDRGAEDECFSLFSNPTPPHPPFKWLWLPAGTLDPSLGFPAPPRDVRRNRRAAKTLTLTTTDEGPLPVLAPMDRSSYYGKRSFEDSQGGYHRSREQDLRQKLDREQEEQRRQQRSRDRDGDRGGGSSRRMDEDRFRQERLPPPPPGPRGREPGRGPNNKRSNCLPRPPQGSGPLSPTVAASASGVAGPANPDAAHITCYNCGKLGHIQAECTDDSFCVNCKKPGHISAMCAAISKALAPFWAGYGGGHKGFMCCEVPQEELQQPIANSATVIIEQGNLSEEEVEDEFKDLVDENWDWQVRRLSPSDFAVVFPSKESLRIAIRGGGLTLPSSKLKALITVQVGDPLASESLVETWVRLIGVPPPLRQADRLLLCTRELGRPIGVDMDSLAHPSAPIRMSVGCQAPVKLQEFITIFVNMQGYRIRVEREEDAAGDSPPHAPLPPPGERGEEDKDEDFEETDEDRWDGRRGRHRKNDKEVASAPAKGAGGKGRKSVPLLGSDSVGQVAADPTVQPTNSPVNLPASAFSQYGSNLTESGDIFPTMAKMLHSVAVQPQPQTPSGSLDSDPPQVSLSLICDTPEEPNDAGQSEPTPGKAIQLSHADRQEAGLASPDHRLTQEQVQRDSEKRSKSNHDRPSRRLMLEAAQVADCAVVDQNSPATPVGLHQAPAISHSSTVRHLLLEDSPIPALGAAVTRAPRSKAMPALAERKSARGKGLTEGPVLERAVRLTADKNAMNVSKDKATTSSSSHQVLGTSSLADFTVFQDSSVDHLLRVAKDSCILFKAVDKSPAQLVELIQAKEVAQAELAAARQKVEVQIAKDKEQAQEKASASKSSEDLPPHANLGMEAPPIQQSPRGALAKGSGKLRSSPAKVARRRAAARPNPIGTRPLTRRARALQLVSQ